MFCSFSPVNSSRTVAFTVKCIKHIFISFINNINNVEGKRALFVLTDWIEYGREKKMEMNGPFLFQLLTGHTAQI